MPDPTEDKKTASKVPPRDNVQENYRYRNVMKNIHQTKTNCTVKGSHLDIQGHIHTYDGHARSNQYNKTTKKIVEYAKN